MIRVFFALLLFLNSAAAWAEWVKYGEGTRGRYYYDDATLARDGSLVQVWIIIDLEKRGEKGDQSFMALDEFDCERRRLRAHYLSVHEEHMALGKTLLSHSHDLSKSPWREIAPNTPPAILLEILCK